MHPKSNLNTRKQTIQRNCNATWPLPSENLRIMRCAACNISTAISPLKIRGSATGGGGWGAEGGGRGAGGMAGVLNVAS